MKLKCGHVFARFYKKLFNLKAMGPAAMIVAEAGGIGGHITALGHEPQHYDFLRGRRRRVGVSGKGKIAGS